MILQQAVTSNLDSPVQNTIGETITFTNPLTLENSSVQHMDLACFHIGERTGDCVAVFLTNNGLFYRDVASANSDPLNSIEAPARRTVTFSLLEAEGLVTTNSSTQFKVITTAIPDGIAGSTYLSAFVVVYINTANQLNCTVFSYSSNVYVANNETNIVQLTTLSHIDGIQKSRLFSDSSLRIQDDIQDLTRPFNTISVRLRQQTGFRMISFDFATGHILENQFMPVDNNNQITDSQSIIISEQSKFVGISVHTSTNTEAAPITVRSVENGSVSRPSYGSTIPPGDYSDVSTFIEALSTAMQEIDINFHVAYLAGTTKIMITNPHSAFRILLSDVFQAPNNLKSCIGLAYILGFRNFTDVVSSFVNNQFSAISSNRIDMKGRQYLYLYLSNNDNYISNESSSRNVKNSFGRIVLATEKGDVMYFMSKSNYKIEANTNVAVLNTLSVQLGRFSQLTNDVDSSRELLLYEPQGVEHSFCLKITCLKDKQGSATIQAPPHQLPVHMRMPTMANDMFDDDSDLSDYV